jgi:hypothetical protein
MRAGVLLSLAALTASPLAQAQVSTATAALAQVSLTGVDLDPGDTFLPLAYGLGNLVFTSYYRDYGLGQSVVGVSQNAGLAYSRTFNQGAGSVVEFSNDGAGLFSVASTATGSAAMADGSFGLADDPLAPIVINPHTRYTLAVNYAVASAPSPIPLSVASAGGLAFLALVRPGMPPQGANPVSYGGNAQGPLQLSITNDSDVPGTLVFRLSGFAQAQVGVVPEPGTPALWLLGLAAVGAAVTRGRWPSTPG